MKPSMLVWLASGVLVLHGCGPKKSASPERPAERGQLGDNRLCSQGEGIIGVNEGVPSKRGKYCVKLQWSKGPVADDFSEARITFTTPALKKPAKVDAVRVSPWMKIHGHGTGDVQPELQPLETHIWAVTNLYFMMSGSWQLNIEAVVDGESDGLEYLVEVPK